MEEKKKSTKKKATKEVKEKKVVEEKSAVPNPEPFGVRFKSFVSSYKFLYVTFGILLIIVLILGALVFVKGGEDMPGKSNIVFSILEKNTNNYIDLDLEGLKNKDYLLKVTNFRGNKINKDGARYSLTIINDTGVEIEILKNNTGDNLMNDANRTVIEGEDFGIKEKEEVIYYIKVKNPEAVKDGDKIRVEVES